MRLLALLAILLLGACAPTVQTAAVPGPSFAGPRIEEDAFVSFDGARLGLTRWGPEAEPWAVIVALHGMNDYAAHFHLAGDYWAGRGIATYAIDQRGFGRSPNRGVWPGQDLIVRDIRTLTAVVRARHPGAIVAVVGVSMGGAGAVAAFSSAQPPDADRLVLLAPAVWGWSAQPLPNKTALWLTSHVAPGWVLEPPRVITNRIDPTDNIDELRRMGRDPLMLWGARTDALYGIVGLMQTGWRDTGRIQAPTLYLYGYRDEIIPRRPSVQAAARLKPTDKTGFYRDGYHLLLSDLQRERVFLDVEGFLRDPTAPLASGVVGIPKR